MEPTKDGCELCRQPGGEPVWHDALCRVVLVPDADYPAYCRVIWGAHVREMTDLAAVDRRHFMTVVFAVEAALRALTGADKINLASLGNMTPHLHWHVVARRTDDRHFPAPIWGRPQREAAGVVHAPPAAALQRALIQALAEEHGGVG